jgi:hypothetical protein
VKQSSPAKAARGVKRKNRKDRSAWIVRRSDEISRRMSGFTLVHANTIIQRVALDVATHELSSIEAGRPRLHGGYMPPLPNCELPLP